MLSRLDRALFKFESFLALVGGSLILALMFLAVAQILGRKFLNMPVLGFIDLVEQAMAVFAFMGIAYCQRLGGHIRMDIVVGALKGRALWLVEIIAVVFMLLLTMALTLGSWLHFKRAFDNGDSSMDIGIPLWPAKLVVPLALSILVLRLLMQLWGYSRAFMENAERPVAVPLVESAAEQAAHEADVLHGEDDEPGLAGGKQ
jgi:TRAP-type C4-dicarboxylate transport system permease small subunit